MGQLDLSRRAGVAAIVAAVCGAGLVTALLAGSGSSTERTATIAVVRTVPARPASGPATTVRTAAPPTTTAPPVSTRAVPRLADVTGQPLDQARSVVEAAGAEVRVDGGGLFGVVDESAWTVCETDPAAGTPLTAEQTVTLHVERSCG